MKMNDLAPYFKLYKELKESGIETLQNKNLEKKEKEYTGKEITVRAVVIEIDTENQQLITSYVAEKSENNFLFNNRLINHIYTIFASSLLLAQLLETSKIKKDDLVELKGRILSLHRHSMMRINVSSINLIKRNYRLQKWKGEDGCFIATLVYENPGAKQVQAFYRFRDEVLSRSFPGKWLIGLYYRISPTLADWIANKPRLKYIIRKYVLNQIFYMIDRRH